jgi:CBS domain-containing protein
MASVRRGPRWPRSESAAPPGIGIADRPVSEVMSVHVVAVPPNLEASRAVDLAHEKRVEHLIVSRGSELVGVLCTCDLWEAVRAPVAAVMSTPPVTIGARSTLGEAAALVSSTGVGCLPVLDHGRVVGVLTRGDLARLGLIDLTDLTCASCGSHHHVRRLAGYDSAFCALCLDSAPPVGTYDELGWGD